MSDTLEQLTIPDVDEEVAAWARERWDSLAKPLGALGALEDAITRICALTGERHPPISKRCVVTCCADNGVLAQGISSSGIEVTALVADNVARGVSSVSIMCAAAGTDSIAVDVGMATPSSNPHMRSRRIAAGTADICRGPAMSESQARQAIQEGIDLASELADAGYRMIGLGEVGMGNTTTTAAVTCALTGRDAGELTGRGAGLTDEGLRRKVGVVRRALEVNQPDPHDPLDVLAKVGGFDIAAMCGLVLGCAHNRIPVVLDGAISCAAALLAFRLRPACRPAMFASHLSPEPACAVILNILGLEPVIHARMRLGEGCGAACMMPLLDMALALFEGGATLEGSNIRSYDPFALR